MHKPWFQHPENPGRIVEVKSALSTEGYSFIEESIQGFNYSEALKTAKRVHSSEYIEYLEKLSRRAPVEIDEDTYMAKDTLNLALGFLNLAYEYSLKSNSAFLIGRPPGHHAGFNGATPGVSTQGFCILNNAAGAIRGFIDAGYTRILALDFDAHHGNGTMEIFYRERILQVDLHQDPTTLYPHTGYPDEVGEGEGYGYKANIVLPRYTGDDLLVELVGLIRDLLVKYSPEAIVVSAGFDAFENDGLADLALTEASYYALGSLVRELNAPTVVLLEGGYSVGLKRGLLAFIKGLQGESPEYPLLTKTPSTARRLALESTSRVLDKVSKRVLQTA
jgi:acetoin utilization deacetylase AcuC-like enzyme